MISWLRTFGPLYLDLLRAYAKVSCSVLHAKLKLSAKKAQLALALRTHKRLKRRVESLNAELEGMTVDEYRERAEKLEALRGGPNSDKFQNSEIIEENK